LLIGSLTMVGVFSYYVWKKFINKIDKKTILDIIGHTPLVYLPKLSKACNCEIYVFIFKLRLKWSI